MAGISLEAEMEPGRPRPDELRRQGAPAPCVGFCEPQGAARTGAIRLRLMLNLVNDQTTRLVVRQRLRVIAIARMHPHS